MHDEGHVQLQCGLYSSVDESFDGFPFVLIQKLQIFHRWRKDFVFPPVKQISGLWSVPISQTSLLVAHAHSAPGSIQETEAESSIQLLLILVGVCSSSASPGWIFGLVVQVQASLLLFLLKQLVS